MNIQIPAYIVIVIFVILIIIQVALALGAPIAEISWGGKYQGVLPGKLRIASLVSVGVFVLMILAVLDESNMYDTFSSNKYSNGMVWFFAGFLVLNTLGNLASDSKKEKLIMTPLSAVACICMFVIAIN